MNYLKLVKIVILLLPEFIKLVRILDERYSEAQLDKKIKDDMAVINEAFKTKDATLLNNLFNS